MNEEEEKVEPCRKNNSIETELYIQYFGKRESQKETRDSGTKVIEDVDFYYPI